MKKLLYLLFIILIFSFIIGCKKNEKKIEKKESDLSEKDFEAYCLNYYEPDSPYIHVFDKIENGKVYCKILQIDGKKYYKPTKGMKL